VKFDVITPTLNQAQFLPWTVNSIKNQNGNFLNEHFIIDGGSNDGTLSYLNNISDKSIKWHSFSGMTQSQALILGFSQSESEVQSYLNSDDLYLTDALEKARKVFKDYPDVEFVYFNRIIIDEANRMLGLRWLPKHSSLAVHYAELIPQETLFWRKTALDRIGTFSSTLDFAMDYDFVVRLFKNCKGMHVNDFVAVFRMHSNSKTVKNYSTIGKSEVKLIQSNYNLNTPEVLRFFFSKIQLVHGKINLSILTRDKRIKIQEKILNSVETPLTSV
jgi:glycosyltransferase involved in cell wall biosynthesis